MYIVRNIFRLQFGKAKEAIAIMKEGLALMERGGVSGARLLVDTVGDFYTLVLEIPTESLDSVGPERMPNREEWQRQYARFTPLVLEGRREIFRVVE
jgi:hypothetical protein